LSQYAFLLPLGIPLLYHDACANNLEPLNILNAICRHMVSQMFLSMVVNLALHALSELEALRAGSHHTHGLVHNIAHPSGLEAYGPEANVSLF
jgi:hypothetical protein